MTLAELGADVFSAPSLVSKPVVSYDWEVANGGYVIRKYQDGQEVGALQLIGDDALIFLDSMNRANDRYPAEQVLADYFGSY